MAGNGRLEVQWMNYSESTKVMINLATTFQRHGRVRFESLTASVIVSISFSASHGSATSSSVGIGSLLGSVRATTVSGVPLAVRPSWIPGIAGIVPAGWNSHISVCCTGTNSSSARPGVSICILIGLVGWVTRIYEGNWMVITIWFSVKYSGTEAKVIIIVLTLSSGCSQDDGEYDEEVHLRNFFRDSDFFRWLGDDCWMMLRLQLAALYIPKEAVILICGIFKYSLNY